MGWVKRNALWAGGFLGGAVYNIALQKGYLNWVPDAGLVVGGLLIAILIVFGVWHHPTVNKLLLRLYSRNAKMFLGGLIVLGAILGGCVAAAGYLSIKKANERTPSPRNVPKPKRATILTTLVIDSVESGKVMYHLQVKNGEEPIKITSVRHKTSEFLHLERGPMPRDLLPGGSLAINGGNTHKSNLPA